MKTIHLALILLVMGVLNVSAQNSTTSPTGQPAIPPPTPYQVANQGANFNVWQHTVYEQGPNGQIVPRIHAYEEMVAGLHYKDASGNWADSKEQIEAYATGAIAQQGQYQVIFASDLNSAGAIDMQTPDGKELRSSILGLAYYDSSSGQSVMFAQVQDSQGEIISANRVLYPNAFSGAGVDADVRYTYKKGSFEQDVIIRQQLPTPESFGLNSATTEIQVLTEFIDPPELRPVTAYRDPEADQDISWGTMLIGHGKAFDLGSPPPAGSPISVNRQYLTMDGRYILLERVPLQNIQASLSSLPKQASLNPHPLMIASRKLVLPKTPLARIAARPMQLASAAPASQGLVLDYIELDTDPGDITFESDYTYYIADQIGISGTTTFEGGCVIKFNPCPSDMAINLYGAVNCEGTPYRPVIFTSQNDGSVGESLYDSSKPLAWYNLPVGGPSALDYNWHDIRVKYAQYGIDSHVAQMHDCQFVNCLYPLVADFYGGGSITATNILIVNASSAFSGIEFSATVYNLTVNNCTNLINDWDGYTSSVIALTNSLLVNVQNLGDGTLATNYTASVTDPGGTVLQTVGGASCYLLTNSIYRGAGTTNVPPFALAAIAGKTTYPPVVFADGFTFATNTTLNPYVPRETNGLPDLGYHYSSVDYVVADAILSNNITLNLTPGTVFGWYIGSSYGLLLSDGANFTSTGTATSPCWVTHTALVQEGNGNWENNNWPSAVALNGDNPTDQPQVNMRFTKWSGLDFSANLLDDGGYYGVANFSDCEFYSGAITSYNINLFYTNCLFFRPNCELGASFTCQNCTFYNGAMAAGASGTVKNTIFDGTALYSSGGYDSYNAYNTNNLSWQTYQYYSTTNVTLETVETNDLYVDGINWQSSWFGDFYLPTSSLLINHGSTNANLLGLYHFTTQTNQVKETNSIVDIGYHYVATDTNGIPIDSNGDGVPDYIEDINGDGLCDVHGETNWALVIYIQPVSQTIPQGSNVTFMVTAQGVNPLYYQWFDGTTALTGATNTTLTLTNVQGANDGSYYVCVSNSITSSNSATASLVVSISFDFTNFCGVTNLQINGNGFINTNDCELELTPSVTSNSSTAFLTTPVFLANGASFSTYFSFRLNKAGGSFDTSSADGLQGADGITFMLQTLTNNVGGNGGGIGYAGISNSVAVEFDTWHNSTDPTIPGTTNGDGNHVGIDLDGSVVSVAWTNIPTPMNNSNVWYTWIDYNSSSSNLQVRLSETNSRPANPTLAYTVNILSHIHTNSAYIGFSAATGGSWNQQDILSWQFVSPYNPIGSTNLSVTILSPTNQTLLARSAVTITATATNSSPSFPVNYVQFFVGSNSIGYVTPTNGVCQISWYPVSSGTDVLTALAVNTNGLIAWSSPVTNYIRNIPTVNIINPTNGQVFSLSPTNITIQATATADRSAISNVVFYAGTNVLGSTNGVSPFTFIWNTNYGTYLLTAKATDTNGAVGASHPVEITVNPDNQGPLVYAGPNQTTNMPTAQLTGLVSDDGLPSNYLAVTWSEVSGPTNGTVIFGNTNLPFTTATFNTNGIYVLQLSANDGQFTMSSNVTINVLVTNHPPIVNAGTNLTLVWPMQPGPIAGPLPTFSLTSVANMPGPNGIDYYIPSNCVIVSANGESGLPWNFALVSTNGATNQFSAISNLTDEVYIATVRNTLGGFNVGEMFCGDGTNGEILRLEPNGTTIGANGVRTNAWVDLPTFTNNGVVVAPGLLRGGLWVDQTGVWGGDLIVTTIGLYPDSEGRTTNGYVWRINHLGQATFVAKLDGSSASGDGDTYEGITTCPNDVQKYGPWAGRILVGGDFNNIYTIDTNGRVMLYDLGIGDEDIRVIPANENFFGDDYSSFHPGTIWGASASEFQDMVGDLLFADEQSHLYRVKWDGTNFQTFFMSTPGVNQFEGVNFAPAGIGAVPPIMNYVTLNGFVTDDGELFAPTSNLWTEVSGPAPMTFDQATLTNTLARFTTPGIYTLRLSAYDGQFTSYSNVQVKVAYNQPPVVNAGTNFSTSIFTSIPLNGSVSDDGLPFGVTNIVWRAVQGPGMDLDVSFGNSNAAATTLTVPQLGIYVLMLTADDGQTTNSAEVTVTVGTTNISFLPYSNWPTLTNVPYSVTARVVDANDNPVTNLDVSFQLFPPGNPRLTEVFAPLDSNGNATFTYMQTNLEEDEIVATLCDTNDSYIEDVNGFIQASEYKYLAPSLTCGLFEGGYPVATPLNILSNQNDLANFYVINLTNGQNLSLNYTNSNDNVLVLHDPLYHIVAINNDGEFNYTALSSGAYVVEMANTDTHGGSSVIPQYTLSLDCGSVSLEQPQMGAIFNGTNYLNGQTVVFPTTVTNVPVTVTLTITNFGLSDLLISNVSLTGDFTNLSGTNYDIPGQSSTNLVLQFNASSNEICGGQLIIQNNTLLGIYILNLAGSAFVPGSLPNVQILSPANGSTNFAPATFSVVASASSTATNIAYLDLQESSIYGAIDLGRYTNASGIFIYPVTNLPSGDYTFQATAADAAGRQAGSRSIVVHVAVNNETSSPVAVDDSVTVEADSANNVFSPLANDSNPNPYPLTISSITAPENGSARIINNGTAITYTPQAGIRGYPNEPADGFYYTVSDGHGGTAEATVYIYINATDIPSIVLTASNYTTTAGTLDPISASNGPPDAVKVDFYQGVDFIGEVTNETNGIFTLPWTASYDPNGGATISAAATDQFGQVGVASPININVTAPTNGGRAMAFLDQVVDATGTSQLTTNLNLIRDGIFQLYGRAYHTLGSNVTWQVGIYTFDGTLIRELSPLTSGTVGTSNTPADLMTCDLTTLMNGVYDLRLTVSGGYMTAETDVNIQLESNLKIGQFGFSQQDLIIPVSGVPLAVTRTYNSLNLDKGDFGYGWTYALDDLNASLDETRVDTNDLDGDEFSLRTGGSWDVTLTLPNGQVTTFAFNLVAGGNGTYYAEWDAAPGVTAKLGLLPNTQNTLETLVGSVVGNQNLFYWDAAGPGTPMNAYDFPGFVLTNLDGTQYYLTRDDLGTHFIDDGTVDGTYVQAWGDLHLSKIIDRNGNVTTINPTSIVCTATNGATRQVVFSRNSDNLITSISDPNDLSNSVPVGPAAARYDYDANDNLIDVQNLVTRGIGTNGIYVTNSFSYTNANFPHYITGIINANGTQVAQNFYDDTGKLTAVQDANGNLTRFLNNPTNNTDVIIDRLRNTNTYVYDLRGNVIAQTNQLGQITQMAYDANNNKTNEITFLGTVPYATNNYLYDTNLNEVLVSTDALGHTNAFAYDSFGNVLTNTDAKGNSTINTYDGDGNLIQTMDALGHTNDNFYGGGLLMGSQDAVRTITTNYYDGSNNLIATATLDASGAILSSNSFTYDQNNNRLTSTVWRKVGGSWTGATTTSIYDAMNRVVQTINPDGGTNTVIYNATGQQQATIDPLGRTTSYVYDAQNRLIQTLYPDGTSESSFYDSNGNRTNSVDRNGNPTTYVYDALNRPMETIYADGSTNATVYDGVGRTAQTMDALGNITAYSYDAAGRRLAVTNAVGTTVQMVSSYGYDANGNQITSTDANNHSITNVFDALNRQIQVLYADGTANETVFDADGRKVAATNQDSIVTLFGYDGAGRLTLVTNAVNKAEQMVTRYQYDEAGNETLQIDGLGRTNSFGYDGQGRRTFHTMPTNGLVELFGYDLAGNMIAQTNFNGVVITNEYDANNRLTNCGSAGGYAVSYAYTATGQRRTMTDPSGVASYSYDVRDRLLNKTEQWNQGPVMSLNYGYNANGEVTNIWSGTSNGVNLAYSYDPLSRLTNVLAGGSTAAGYGFDNAGNLQTIREGNGVTNLYQYDALNRLTNMVWKTNGMIIASFAYQLGLTGTRTGLTETNNGTSQSYAWSYDNLYRLTNEVTGSLGSAGYRYDTVGNRTNRSSTISGLAATNYSYNANDWLTTDKYDGNGNTTNSAGTNYQYDVMNHLVNANNGQVVLAYDGDGNRVVKVVGGVTNYYLVDDRNPSGYAQVLEELQGTTLSQVYNYGMDLISQIHPGSATNYYGFDGHGSVRFLTGLNGGITDTYAYDAYGTLIAKTGTTANNYLYCCQQWDPALGLYYNRARYLNPNTGRFWTKDTHEGTNEDPLSLHKYLYAQDNPVDGIDPSGNDDIGDVLGAMDISAGLDALPSIATVRRALVPLEKAQIVVTTEIRPGGPKPGVKTKQGVGVSSHGKRVSYFEFVGVTETTYLADPGAAVFDKGTSGDRDDVTVYMGATAHSAFLPPVLSIRYEYEVDLNFVTHRGHLSGYNRQFPSYNVQVNGKQVYDFQQQHFLGLTGYGAVEPNIDFAF